MERFRSSEEITRKYPRKDNPGINIAASDIDTALTFRYGKSNWKKLRGLRILDLACGSEKTPRTKNPEGWPPHFCRLCANNGAIVFGIDIYPASEADSKIYTHVQTDLVATAMDWQLPNLPAINGIQFDIIHSRLFLLDSYQSRDYSHSLATANVITWDFEPVLLVQLKQMLVQGGIALLEENVYRREQDALKKLR